MDNGKPMSWNQPEASQYTKTISRKIPGYSGMYEMMDCYLSERLDGLEADPRLLIVGAGGGQELVTLGRGHLNWTFTGIDLSAQMLEMARARLNEVQHLEQRVSLFHGGMDQLPRHKPYQAATCMLVLHFVQGIEAKLALLRGIAGQLEPGAPLALAAISGHSESVEFALQMQAWRRYMLSHGVPEEDWERFAASFRQGSDPVPSETVIQLLREAGFSQVTRFFGSFLIEGYFAIAGGS